MLQDVNRLRIIRTSCSLQKLYENLAFILSWSHQTYVSRNSKNKTGNVSITLRRNGIFALWALVDWSLYLIHCNHSFRTRPQNCEKKVLASSCLAVRLSDRME